MDNDDLPLFAWKAPSSVRQFPLCRQRQKVFEVAGKMLTKSTDRHAEQYRDQVSHALARRLSKYEADEAEINEQLKAFWEAVQAEIIRRCYSPSKGQDPRGAA